MIIKKTRKEGGSLLLVLPRNYCRELALIPGDYVTVRPDHQGNLILTKLEDYHERTRRPAPPPDGPNPPTH